MPKITQVHDIDISPEKYLNACSAAELLEIDILIQSPRFYNKIKAIKSQLTIELPASDGQEEK